MIALGASKEPNLAFISRSELAEPPDSQVVPALGTLNLDSWHSLCLTIFLNNDNLILTAPDSALHLISCHQSFGYIHISGISAGPPMKLTYFYIQDRTSV